LKNLHGQWPLLVFAMMFIVLPIATIPGLFDMIFVVLGGFTLVILGLIIASLVTSRAKATNGK
jgi:hypothetical protein